MKPFITPHYSGVWLPYTGDRMAFRAIVQSFLQKEFEDPKGILEVKDDGPHWRGAKRILLSYSHTEKQGVLVYSETYPVGVDLESLNRKFHSDLIALATRFFHPSETETIRSFQGYELRRQFIRFWVKKEAYAKLTRDGLSKTMSHSLAEIGGLSLQCPDETPAPYFCIIALKP